MMFGVHPDLRRYVSVAFYLSAAVGVTGVLFLILGISQNSAGTPHCPFIIFGIVAILSGYLDPFLCRTSSTNVSASEELRGYG